MNDPIKIKNSPTKPSDDDIYLSIAGATHRLEIQPHHEPGALFILSLDPLEQEADQTWLQLDAYSYLVQRSVPAPGESVTLITVVGIAPTDGADPYVLLLG